MTLPVRACDAPRALRTVAVCVALLAPTLPAQSQDAAARQLLEQKIRLVGQLLGDSPSARRVAASGDAAAQSQLAEATRLYAHARSRLEAGDVEGGMRSIDAAMGAVGKARQRTRDGDGRDAELRARYEGRLRGVESLLGVLRAREAATPVAAGAQAIDAAAAAVDAARGEAAQGRLPQAAARLDQAEATLARALDHYLAQREVDYTVRHATPADAYRHELSRQRSLEALVPLAMQRLRPAAETRDAVARYVAESARLRESAQAAAARDDHDAALRALADSIGYLERALTSAGLVVPVR